MSGALRYRKLWLGIGFALVALVIYLSLTPHPVDAGELGGISVGHVTAYLMLMLWFAQVFQGWRARLAIGAGLSLMGAGLEYAQSLTFYRTFDVLDMRDNAVGVVAGLAIGATPLGMALAKVEEWVTA